MAAFVSKTDCNTCNHVPLVFWGKPKIKVTAILDHPTAGIVFLFRVSLFWNQNLSWCQILSFGRILILAGLTYQKLCKVNNRSVVLPYTASSSFMTFCPNSIVQLGTIPCAALNSFRCTQNANNQVIQNFELFVLCD